MNNNGIVYFDGTGKGKGGLCDRLKGMYASFNLSKQLKKEFSYDFPCPVALKMKKYDPVVLDSFQELNIIDWDNYLSNKDKIKKLEFSDMNYKIHTNIDFSDDFLKKIHFFDFLNTFFDIDAFLEDYFIENYDVGIHVRCGGKMVDWNDSDFGFSLNLNDLKSKLIDISKSNENIFLCSDSNNILKYVDSLKINNITTSSSIPKHIDRSNDITEEDYINAFKDFLTLSQSKIIYYTRGDFAKTASKIKNNELRYLFS